MTQYPALFEIFVILAVWRLSFFLIYEHGPYGLASRLRKFIFFNVSETLATCLACVSFWIGLVIALSIHWGLEAPIFALAYSAGAIILQHLNERFGIIEP